MIRGLLGKKIGMTEIFDKDGNVIPVSVLEVGPCTVLECKETPKRKVTLGFEPVKESHVKRPQVGFFKKISVNPLRFIREIESSDNKDYKVGQDIKVDIFRPGDFVDVAGVTKGKGFQGGVRRWNWAGGPQAHGSMHHRRVGSVSASSDPSRVFKGAHMPGHMGACRLTVQGLRVIVVDCENNLLLVKGSVPGYRNSYLTILRSQKKAYQSLEEKKPVVIKQRNPMKQSKAKVAGKGTTRPAAAPKGGKGK
jgi:large subunit ribosomal protein L3